MAKEKKGFTWWRRIKRLFLILLLLNLGYILITKWINPPITVTMLSSWVQGYGLQRQSVAIENMGNNTILALIAAEDQLFAEHNGFDVDAIKKAIKYNKDPKKKKILGASTITQQTAKNVFLWNGRNWFRKGLEVYHTFMIELIWRKKRILENYLNVAEMGKGIFGIEAAAKFHFNKTSNKLSSSEAAWIASILPNPKEWSIKSPSSYVKRRHAWILKQMENLEGDPEIAEILKAK